MKGKAVGIIPHRNFYVKGLESLLVRTDRDLWGSSSLVWDRIFFSSPQWRARLSSLCQPRVSGEQQSKGAFGLGGTLLCLEAKHPSLSLFLNIWWALHKISFSQRVCSKQTKRIKSIGPDPKEAPLLLFCPALTSAIAKAARELSFSGTKRLSNYYSKGVLRNLFLIMSQICFLELSR